MKFASVYFLFLLASTFSLQAFGLTYSLDAAGNLPIEFKLSPDRKLLNIHYSGHLGDNPVHQNDKVAQGFLHFIRSKIEIRVNDHTIADPSKPVPLESEKKTTLDLFLKGADANSNSVQVGHWELDPHSSSFGENTAQTEQVCKMGTYAVRELAQFGHQQDAIYNKFINRFCVDRKLTGPIIDLHTHLAGTHRPGTLLELARQNKIPVDMKFLTSMGIRDLSHFEKASTNQVFLDPDKMTEEMVLRFHDRVSICPYTVIPFLASEEMYASRKVILDGSETLGLEDFKNSLWGLAREYQESGVRYVEFSFSDIVQPNFIQTAHREIPLILKDTGVKIRFKAGIRRDSTYDEMNAVVSRIIALNDPLIVGADFMGEEDNSTGDFAYAIEKLREYRRVSRPHFAIQVHAGESAAFLNNVKKAVRSGATQIGHGIHGIDDEALDLLLENDVIVEMNLDSNLALVNAPRIQYLKEVYRKYRKKGVKVVFSTDGHGLYHSSSLSLMLAIRELDLSEEDIAAMKETELAYIRRMDEGYARDMREFSEERLTDILKSGPFQKPLRPTKIITERQIERLKADAAGKNVKVINAMDEVLQFAPGKRPIYFMNVGSSSWTELPLEVTDEIRNVIHGTLKILNPGNYFVITSGTPYGGDASIYSYNLENPSRRFQVLGLAPLKNTVGRIESGNDGLYLSSMSWTGRNRDVTRLLASRGGLMIVLGGNEKARQMLQMAFNMQSAGGEQGFDVLVYKNLVGTLAEIAEKFGDESIIGNKSLSKFMKEVKEKSHNPPSLVKDKPLPLYCSLEDITPFLPSALKGDFEATTDRSLAEKEEMARVLKSRNIFPYEEEEGSILTQFTIQNEFEKSQSHFHTPLNLEPRGLIQFFSNMEFREAKNHLVDRMRRGKNGAQALAKLCVYFAKFAKLDPNLETAPFGHPLRVSAVDNSTPMKELLEHRKTYSEFYYPGDQLPRVDETSATERSRTLVLLRGIDGLETFAKSLKEAARKAHPNLSVSLVGTRPQYYRLLLNEFPTQKFWSELKDETLSLTYDSVRTLMEAGTDLIVYADMNKDLRFMEKYENLAREKNYRLVILKVGDLSLQNIKRYVKKHTVHLFTKGQWLQPSLRLNGDEFEQKIAEKDMNRNLEIILAKPGDMNKKH